MVTLRANEEWRKDPERLKKARNLCTLRASHLKHMIEALKVAQEHGNMLHYYGETDVPSQALHIERLERSYLHYSHPTDTLIGNLAAFGKGN